MDWNFEWHDITGNVEVTVRAQDDNERFKKFTFACYISEEVNDYDRLDYLYEIACLMAKLRNYRFAEITDIQSIFPRNLLTE